MIKIYYDVKHISLFFKSDDKVYFRLHKSYNLANKYNKKLFSQKCKSFIFKKRINRLVYQLKLFRHDLYIRLF